jgi:hypothetical protein
MKPTCSLLSVRMLFCGVWLLSSSVGLRAAEAPKAASNPGDSEGVKRYLVAAVEKMDAAAAGFLKDAEAYQKLIAAHGGDYAKTLAEARPETQALIKKLRDGYEAMDSYGYETVEGIVAGVPSLNDFDVYLDAGVPKAEAAPDKPAAPVKLTLINGETLEGEGCLFTYLIEPSLWGGNAKYIVPADVNGDGKIGPRESLPKVELIAACAVDVRAKIAELLAASKAWQPTLEDCLKAIATMTPTLPGYFDDWKESRYSDEKSGRFSAVSRVSDMRGIMMSVSVLYHGIEPQVTGKDKALGRAIDRRFKDVLAFIDRIDAREKKGKITLAEIEGLSVQAKEKADQLAPQIEQAAALLGVKLSS